jgi:predicted RNase H-like HicB family nuclease
MSDLSDVSGEIVGRAYTRLLTPNPEGNWSVQVLEFPGCIAEGDTPNEALIASDQGLRSVVEVMLEDGDDIPLPVVEREFSGATTVRMPPSLHRRASVLAHLEGTSLNRLIQTAVAEYVGGARSAR